MWWQQKWFWALVVTTLINIGQYFLTNHFIPQYDVLITVLIGILQIIEAQLVAVNVVTQRISKMLGKPN